MKISVKAKRIIWFLIISLAIYFTLIFFFAWLYYSTGSIAHYKAVRQTMEKIDFLEALYFSVVSFHTIGYGDIYPVSQQGRMILMTQSFLSLFYTSIFAGMLVYFIIRRHADLFTTKHVYIRVWKDHWYLSIRLGNKSRAIIDLKGRFEAWVVEDDSRVSMARFDQEMPDLENILYFDVSLDDPYYASLRKALRESLAGGPRLHMKFNFVGSDIKNGDQIAHSAYYSSDDIRFGRKFLNVYSWDTNGHRTNFKWENFEKMEELEDSRIKDFFGK